MKIAGVQLDIAWEDKQANFERLGPWVDTAVAGGARLVVLPEMYSCGFSMNTATIEEPEDGPSTEFLRSTARRHGIWICGSVPERPNGSDRPYNTFILCAPDGNLHRYRKIHPFTYAREHEHYAPGSAFCTVEVEGLRCTLFVCYDLRFADEFWATANDTDAYLVIANWPQKRRQHWTTLLRARAIENQAYVVGINRVGSGGKLEYSGDSRIFDPWGEMLVGAASTQTLLMADLSPQVVAEARKIFPVLPDRR